MQNRYEVSDEELKTKSFEFIKDRLYYLPLPGTPKKKKNVAFFSVDKELVYWNFFRDFGPLNLGQLYRFCQIMLELLSDPSLKKKQIYFFSSTDSKKRANAAFLISAFAMLYLNRTAVEAYKPFQDISPPFPPFHDASPGKCTYKLTILDCLQGLYKAKKLKCFTFDDFDVDEYEHFERVECGDLNWIINDKFLAFAGPSERKIDTGDGYKTFTPDDYIPYFKKKNVSTVVRLNKKYYDGRRFTKKGIDHVDLYYIDGGIPPEPILQEFLRVCEEASGAIAVHCKAGLGRTGTCIACYMIKHHGFTAAEAIGYIRITRPGSIIGQQQDFLAKMEARLMREGEEFRLRNGARNAISRFEMSREEEKSCGSYESKSLSSDESSKSQGDKLRAAKTHNRTFNVSIGQY